MKTKTLKIAVLMLFFAGSFYSCKKQNITGETIKLSGTKWKLAGIVNTETGVLTELEPKDCAECYTLTFITEKKAEGKAYTEPISIEFSKLGEYDITDIGRPIDEEKFILALFSPNTISYSVTSNELRFINQAEKYYLLFKLQKP